MKPEATFDTSFWINAHRSNLLRHVREHYSLVCTNEVADELLPTFESGLTFWQAVDRGGIELRSAKHLRIDEFGRGERAAMNLAITEQDLLLLMDDRRPYMWASTNGISVVCSPALVAHLYSVNIIKLDEALEIVARLASMNTVSPILIESALASLSLLSKSPED